MVNTKYGIIIAIVAKLYMGGVVKDSPHALTVTSYSFSFCWSVSMMMALHWFSQTILQNSVTVAFKGV